MFYLLFSNAVVSLGSLLLFLKYSSSRRRLLVVAAFALCGGMVARWHSYNALMLQMAFAFAVASFCLLFNPRLRIVKGLTILAPVAAYLVVIGQIAMESQRIEALRREFPKVSLADRLAYEKTRQGVKPDRVDAPIALSTHVEERLANLEQRLRSGLIGGRNSTLEALHDQTEDEFRWAQGFGPVRMLNVDIAPATISDNGPIVIASPAASDMASVSEPISAATRADQTAQPPAPIESNTLTALHDEGLVDLFDRDRMGYVEDREHVVGFEPHRFTKMPGASAAPLKTEWRLVRLELIGLLRHERPKAYVSAHLPRLDELKDAATRDLDAVEQTALNRLEKDEDIVIDETPDRVRMVGSLRAGNDCVACHDAPRGKLLGALTYELVPIRRRANEQPARAL